MTNKHTPGPWAKVWADYDGNILIEKIGGFEFANDDDILLMTAAPETAAERDRLKEINAGLLGVIENVLPYLSALRDIDPAVAIGISKFYADAKIAITNAQGES